MAQINIYGDIDSSSIFFINSSVNPKGLGTIVATLVENDRIKIERTDRFQEDGVTYRVLFKKLNPARVMNKDGEDLMAVLGYTAQGVVDYINDQASLSGGTEGGDGTGTDLSLSTVDFSLDATSTSVMLSTGHEFGVNTIKAVDTGDGCVTIVSELGDLNHFKLIGHTSVQVNGSAVAGGLTDVINTLNELFTVGAFESVVISDPYSTMVADVAGTTAAGSLVGDAINPSNSDIGAGNSAHYNKAGWLSTDTIDQAGEYFTFDIRNEGIIGMGLVVDDAADIIGNTAYGDPAAFCSGTPNSGYYGLQFGHFFHPSPNGPWTNYGASTSMVYGPGWSNVTHRFISSEEGADWLAGNPVKMRVGIDENGFIAISYYDNSESSWILVVRTTYPTVSGVKYKLGIKFCDSLARLASEPKVHLLAALAPTMYFRYIESPDGVFHYPLFNTAEEAEYYDEIHNGLSEGTGRSHTHTYVDDPTNTTWYMPEDSHDPTNYTYSSAPDGTETFSGNVIAYTEVTSVTNSDLTPQAFSASDVTQQEGTNVNIQVTPAGAAWSSSVVITPSGSGLVFDGTSLVQGTLTDVGADTTYTITVTRANSYGSSVGSMTVTATDVAPVQTNDTPWTKALDFSGSNEHTAQVSTSNLYNPLRMNGVSTTISAPSSGQTVGNGHPWATAIVFQTPNNTSNQHIWNIGEGAGTNDDNVYLRITGTNGNLYFGWGREGVGYNECLIANIGGSYNQSTGQWWGIYIAHNGTRLSGSDATAANLIDAFDIRLMGTNDTTAFGGLYTMGGSASNWTSTGVRMDRSITGQFTVGGRGSNRNFHGKVASMVVTTLRCGVAMPDATEIEMMITDPIKWQNDYKTGEMYRRPAYTSSTTNFQRNTGAGFAATQIWLMGDSVSDSYANGMRNYIYPSDQNNTKMQLNSMVSNDIQSVSISGLS